MIAADFELSPLEWRCEVWVWVLIDHSLGVVIRVFSLGATVSLGTTVAVIKIFELFHILLFGK